VDEHHKYLILSKIKINRTTFFCKNSTLLIKNYTHEH